MKFYLVIYLVAAIQGFLLCIALFFSIKENKTSNRYLAFTIYVLSITLLDTYLMNTGYNTNWPRIPVGALYSYYLIPPLFYFFVKSRIQINFTWRSVYWLLLFPGLFEITFRLSDYGTLYFVGDWLFPRTFSQGLNVSTEFLPLLWLGVVLWKSWKMCSLSPVYQSHDLKDHLIRENLNWLKQMLIWGMVIWMLNVAILAIEYDVFITLSRATISNIYSGMLLVMAAWIFAIGYRAFSSPFLFHQALELKKVPNPTTTKNFKGHDDQLSLQKLNKVLVEEKIYRQPKLSLKELAHTLQLPSKYVSYLINNYHHKNFHDFINSYRLEEVSNKMQDDRYKNYTLLAIGLEAGFNSKSTFNLAFKKLKGKTPSEYRMQIERQ